MVRLIVGACLNAGLGQITLDEIRKACLLYTSDAADERSSVDLGGRRIIKKKKKKTWWVGPVTEEQERDRERDRDSVVDVCRRGVNE